MKIQYIFIQSDKLFSTVYQYQYIFIQSDRLFSFQELRKDYFLCQRKVKSYGCCTQHKKEREQNAQTLVLNILTDNRHACGFELMFDP